MTSAPPPRRSGQLTAVAPVWASASGWGLVGVVGPATAVPAVPAGVDVDVEGVFGGTAVDVDVDVDVALAVGLCEVLGPTVAATGVLGGVCASVVV